MSSSGFVSLVRCLEVSDQDRRPYTCTTELLSQTQVSIVEAGFESKSLLSKTESMQAIFNEASCPIDFVGIRFLDVFSTSRWSNLKLVVSAEICITQIRVFF